MSHEYIYMNKCLLQYWLVNLHFYMNPEKLKIIILKNLYKHELLIFDLFLISPIIFENKLYCI